MGSSDPSAPEKIARESFRFEILASVTSAKRFDAGKWLSVRVCEPSVLGSYVTISGKRLFSWGRKLPGENGNLPDHDGSIPARDGSAPEESGNLDFQSEAPKPAS